MKPVRGAAGLVLEAAGLGISLTADRAESLGRYEALLRTRALQLGLIAASDESRIHRRHVIDSLRAAVVFEPDDRTAIDLGSGAGLPGLVLALVVPWCRFLLVEPKRIRVGFLELAVETLGIANAEIVPERAEDHPGQADVVTARAFARLERTWQVASRLLRPGGRLIYFAGRSLTDPVGEAKGAIRRGPPAEVSTSRVLATSPPLVIMTRK